MDIIGYNLSAKEEVVKLRKRRPLAYVKHGENGGVFGGRRLGKFCFPGLSGGIIAPSLTVNQLH